jgi:hypothetical protein
MVLGILGSKIQRRTCSLTFAQLLPKHAAAKI